MQFKKCYPLQKSELRFILLNVKKNKPQQPQSIQNIFFKHVMLILRCESSKDSISIGITETQQFMRQTQSTHTQQSFCQLETLSYLER